jgi:hypothetical protein
VVHLNPAVAVSPGSVDAQSNASVARLEIGRWAKALQSDTNVAGRTILLWNEQRLEDAMQMARYVKVLRKAGANVVVQSITDGCQTAL